VTLLDEEGRPATTVTVAGVGTYVLEPATGVVTFTPAPGFSGSARVAYRVTDAYGQAREATYSPTVGALVVEAAVAVEAGAVAPASASGPPQPTTCVSRRGITIHWKVARRLDVVSSSLWVNGTLRRQLPGAAREARIEMAGMPARRVLVRVVATLRDGSRISGTRRYRTCTGRLAHPPLRTLHLRRAR
jgi:hypothetical protein